MNFNQWVEDSISTALAHLGREEDICFQVQSILQPDQSSPDRINGQAYLMSTSKIGVYALIWSMLPFEGEGHLPWMTYPLMPGLGHSQSDMDWMVAQAVVAIDAQIAARGTVQKYAADRDAVAVIEDVT